MRSHVRSIALPGAIAAALALAIAGCGQSVATKDKPVAETAASDAGDDSAAEKIAAANSTVNAADKTAVKVASAESPIQAKRDEADMPKEGEPAVIPEAEAPAPIAEAEAPLPLDDVPTASLKMPKVLLTEEHAATCRLKVGDAFPALKLPDPAGQPQTVADLHGEKLTLVVFWNGLEPTAREELADLARYHQRRFGDEGLAIVAINSGDPPQLAGELAAEAGAKYHVLCDADGAAFQQVATGKIPRSYLLDPAGTILWFDLEYSATTRRDLAQAIRFALAN
jgi:peroxiredoxin